MKIYSNVKRENVDKLARELMEAKKEKVKRKNISDKIQQIYYHMQYIVL